MSRLPRPRLTYANVVSTLCLFILLGGTAVAAVIVSSNSQIGPNTISGAWPTSGNHNNVIPNTIGGADIYEASLGTVPSAAYNGVGVNYQSTTENDTPKPIAQIGGLQILVRCYFDTDFTAGRLHVLARSTGAQNIMGVTRTADTYGNSGPTHDTFHLTGSDTFVTAVDDIGAELVITYREQRADGKWMSTSLPLHVESTGSSCNAFGVASSRLVAAPTP